ncbi:pilus assembly FimT family protein [Desulfuromonas sp. DDH964]|uniref:pilus assembly FimT family protein n=1 Tax=Desulfuromonas sp. DDH964 TaxID=1823759 RepID=UPI0018D3A7FE|nr:prepilin-type N-terminal cleavage/methylation domain-containing protein [Desulfuromonas sp. DDH964]
MTRALSTTVGRRPHWSAAGFTLIELAVVLLLLGIFTALVVPLFAGIGDDALQISARRLAGTAKYLYNEAALTGRPHRLVFDLDGGEFGGRRLETSNELVTLGGTGSDHALPDAVRFRDVVVAGRGKLSSGSIYAAVLPVGWIDETVVHLEGSGGKQLTLRIAPLTGSSEVYEGYREFDNLAASEQSKGR